MDLQTLIKAISNLSFPDYELIEDIICPPDGSIEEDPLKGNIKEKKQNKQSTFVSKSRINYFDTFLFCFFNRFNKDISIEKFRLEFKEFKKVFLDELRNGAMRNWKVSTNKRDKGVILSNIEKAKLDRYLIQWIADYHDIIIRIDGKDYSPRNDNGNKPLFSLSYKDEGYTLV